MKWDLPNLLMAFSDVFSDLWLYLAFLNNWLLQSLLNTIFLKTRRFNFSHLSTIIIFIHNDNKVLIYLFLSKNGKTVYKYNGDLSWYSFLIESWYIWQDFPLKLWIIVEVLSIFFLVYINWNRVWQEHFILDNLTLTLPSIFYDGPN